MSRRAKRPMTISVFDVVVRSSGTSLAVVLADSAERIPAVPPPLMSPVVVNRRKVIDSETRSIASAGSTTASAFATCSTSAVRISRLNVRSPSSAIRIG
jgi:hypothetical protein